MTVSPCAVSRRSAAEKDSPTGGSLSPRPCGAPPTAAQATPGEREPAAGRGRYATAAERRGLRRRQGAAGIRLRVGWESQQRLAVGSPRRSG